MNNLRRAYLSLGSNLGDKLQNLQKCVDLLNKRSCHITAISKVYQTAAWGFHGDDFYNICVACETSLHPQELLETLLNIERKLGRERKANVGYQSRSIDIDILFYEDYVIDEPELKIPHPQLHLRRFVLAPLAEIAPGKIHPQLHKSIVGLLQECPDTTPVKAINAGISLRKRDFSDFQFLAIEGNIGAGKTTLATKIAEDFNGKLVLERFADNPFLPKFYEDMQRYAFPLEMSFLADRYQQFTDDTARPDLFKNFMVSDYDIFKSLVFAKVTLTDDEFLLYRKVFNFMYNEVVKPDVYLYLYQNTARLLENIKKRGRTYEQNIKPDYLDAINQGYLDFIKTHKSLNALILDVSELNFVESKEDYRFIIDQVHDFHVQQNIAKKS